jgi:Zn-dependent protease
MRWSWKLGTFAGIGVFLHATFPLLFAWILITRMARGHGFADAVQGVLFVLLIFVCVVLHEYGHALTARRYGIRTRDIVLLPIGGVARLERMPDDPRQELLVALAGPAVNVVIAAMLFGALSFFGALVPLEALTESSGPMLQRLAIVNVFLVVFNMIPAFPMDGGRVLRALMAMRMDYVRATNLAATIGQGLAFVLGFVGLFSNPFLILIAFFVWTGAGQEAGFVRTRYALAGVPLRDVMITAYDTLSPQDPLARAIELTLTSAQTDFPVVENGQVVGILRQPDMLRGIEEGGRGVTVGQAMVTDFETAELHESTNAVFQRLQRCACRTVPVTYRGQLMGIVTMENVGEFMRIQAALSR